MRANFLNNPQEFMTIDQEKPLLDQLPTIIAIINLDKEATIEYDGCGTHSFSLYYNKPTEPTEPTGTAEPNVLEEL